MLPNEQAWTWCVCDVLNLLGGAKALLMLWFEISLNIYGSSLEHAITIVDHDLIRFLPDLAA